MQFQDLIESTRDLAEGAERSAKEAEYWRQAARRKDIEIQSMKMTEALRTDRGEKANSEKEIESPEHEDNEAGSNSVTPFQVEEGLNNSNDQMDGEPSQLHSAEPRGHTSLFDQIQSDELIRNPELPPAIGENEEEIFGKPIS